MRFAALFLLPASLISQTTARFEGQPALVLANDRLELIVLPQGGALASIVLKKDTGKINPLWDPLRYAREGGKQSFGTSIGHFVCVDGFGPVSSEERDAGLPGHGEAHTRPWATKLSRKEGSTQILQQSAEMPKSQEILHRTIRIVDSEEIVYVQSELENLLPMDRPINWAEHATIGAPFLEAGQTVVDMPVVKAKTREHTGPQPNALTRPLQSFAEFNWPKAPLAAGGRMDMRTTPQNIGMLGHTTCLLDPKRERVWVTALHPGKRLLLGYVFRQEEFPWLQTWMNFPSDGRSARGLEFSTQPYDVPRRQAIALGSMFGAPTYRWLPAKSKIESRYLMFYTAAPEGMTQVDDIRMENGMIVVEDRKNRKSIRLAASLGW
jgi:hypothetical protein